MVVKVCCYVGVLSRCCVAMLLFGRFVGVLLCCWVVVLILLFRCVVGASV